jgi:hypothetical protein
VCGANRRHPGDPVARYLAAARRPRGASAAPAPAAARRSDGRWTAAAFALLPIAAAVGVLVGRGNSDVVAALRAQKAPVVQIGTAPASASATATAPAAAIASDFRLAKGFVVRLSTLPAAGTDAAAVAAAKRAATAKGAKEVGLISPSDFKLTPGSGGAYVLYSGQFATRAAAAKALARLRKPFPGAAIVAVGTVAGARGSARAAATPSHPTAKQKVQGAKIVQEIQARKGKSYVQQQRNLPDTIVVP